MHHPRFCRPVAGNIVDGALYMIRNLRCTVTIDSVFANSKTQNAFLFTVNAIFLYDYPLAMEPGSKPRPLVQKKLGEILYLLICSFLPCLSWLLRSRVRKSRKDLWITLYIGLLWVDTRGPLANYFPYYLSEGTDMNCFSVVEINIYVCFRR